MNGELFMFGGTLGGSGTLAINSSGVMEISSSSTVSVISRTTTNDGTITFPNSSTVDTTFSGATLTNTGLIDIQSDQAINGLGSLDNNSGGVIMKSAGFGFSSINFTVNNAAGATIEVQSGELRLVGGGTVSGAYSISSFATLILGPGTFTMSGNPTVSGAGRFAIDRGDARRRRRRRRHLPQPRPLRGRRSPAPAPCA